jgi:hypothetical protein
MLAAALLCLIGRARVRVKPTASSSARAAIPAWTAAR